jgi:cellobiose phosphorylase
LVDPCIPRHWSGFEIAFRHHSARYQITVVNPAGICRGVVAVRLDGEKLPGGERILIPLVDDGASHRVHVVMG